LSEAEREGFAPLCPDLVVELASPSDEPQALRHKLAAYMGLPEKWKIASAAVDLSC
jgi:Uma2 family endonuclease